MNYNPNISLRGKLFASTPYSELSGMFDKSLISIIHEDSNGVIGVLLNRIITEVNADNVISGLKIEQHPEYLDFPVYLGGPVETEKGMILHSADYKSPSATNIVSKLAISSNLEILKEIARGEGPKDKLFILGHAGWAPGQLHNEIRKNLWIEVPFSEDLIFNTQVDKKWELALSFAGIDYRHFNPACGNA